MNKFLKFLIYVSSGLTASISVVCLYVFFQFLAYETMSIMGADFVGKVSEFINFGTFFYIWLAVSKMFSSIYYAVLLLVAFLGGAASFSLLRLANGKSSLYPELVLASLVVMGAIWAVSGFWLYLWRLHPSLYSLIGENPDLAWKLFMQYLNEKLFGIVFTA